LLGEAGLYYYMLYTTLFMWGVEYLGWEVFLLAAAMDPQRFDEKFLQVVLSKSIAMIAILAEADSPFVFCHDDLADAKGPMFRPAWYEKYIFPRYEQLWRPAKERGKQVIFVADGNMNEFLVPLRRTGVDGVMLENPATDFERILEVFGDKIVIGGIETGVLMHGSPGQVRNHVLEVHERTRGIRGFVMSTPGGLHGNLPLQNLIAYFDARVQTGHTPAGWRKNMVEGGA
jgi:uroporphyrinogen-III decarboxylase